MKTRQLISTAIALAMFFYGSVAHAVPYTLNYSNILGLGVYGTIEIEDLGDKLKVTVKADASFAPKTGEELAWDKFYFNSDLNAADLSLTMVSPGNFGLTDDKNVSMFGLFDIGNEGSTPNGSILYDPLIFELGYTGIEVNDIVGVNPDGYMFAGHLKRIDTFNDPPSLTTTKAKHKPNQHVFGIW